MRPTAVLSLQRGESMKPAFVIYCVLLAAWVWAAAPTPGRPVQAPEQIPYQDGTGQKNNSLLAGVQDMHSPAVATPAVHHHRPHPGLRVALAQLSVEDGDLARNMELVREAASEAARQRADFLNLPEAADYGWLYQRARRDALPIPGRYTNLLSDLAKQYHMWISAGCLEKDGDRVYNSAVIIDRQGEIVLKHRKIDTLAWLTQDLYDNGDPDDIKTVETEFGRIGLTICADNFHIENPQRVAEQGAWLLIAPHGFAAEPDKLEENSIEYQKHICGVASKTGLWVVAANTAIARVQGGAWKDWLHSGCSLVARPDGSAAIMARFKQPDLIVYDIPAE